MKCPALSGYPRIHPDTGADPSTQVRRPLLHCNPLSLDQNYQSALADSGRLETVLQSIRAWTSWLGSSPLLQTRKEECQARVNDKTRSLEILTETSRAKTPGAYNPARSGNRGQNRGETTKSLVGGSKSTAVFAEEVVDAKNDSSTEQVLDALALSAAVRIIHSEDLYVNTCIEAQ